MESKQIQKAGDGSQQLQMVNPTFNIGITEKRAREIFSEMNAIARQNYTQDAYELAMKRVGMFEELLMKKVEQVDGMLDAFRDPSFQFLLVEAQKRAAASDRESDYGMLTELLAHRIEKNGDRKIKASISKAVEIVDQIDDDALCGLTMVYAIKSWGAVAGNISQGLSVMNDLLSSICYQSLPQGLDWAYHLDILNAARVSSFGTFIKLEEYYSKVFEGYICVGIKKESEIYQRANDIIKGVNLSTDILVDHELNDGYVRLAVRDKEAIENITVPVIVQPPALKLMKITTEQVNALNEVWNLYSNNDSIKETVKKAFIQKWDTYDALRTIRLWWDALPNSITITPIGKVLAHANAQRRNNIIPPISL